MIFLATGEDERAALLEYLMLRIGAGKDELVGAMPFEIYGIIRNGMAVGAVLLTNFRGTSVEVCVAGDVGWIGRRDLRAMMRHIFVERGVLRAHGCIKRSNGRSRELAARLGCREIGILEDEYGPGQDGVLYSMARGKCRWLKG